MATAIEKAERVQAMEKIRDEHDVNACKDRKCLQCLNYYRLLRLVHEDMMGSSA